MATGPSSSQTPYIVPVGSSGVQTTSILTVGDAAPNGYKMVGIPDGLGAFDNGDGTFTVLMNHEIASTLGAVRAHGSKGAFVSKWVIKKSDLSVVSGSDLIQNLYLWDSTTSSYVKGTAALSRFCSADLAPVNALYNSATGLGTAERIFLNGEESGAEGRAFAHIVTGASAGNSYELPYLGKFSWENAVASPTVSNKTVVAGMDDNSTNGQVYFYIGTKSNTGTDVEKAGLSGGKLFGVKVNGLTSESASATPTSGTRFSLYDQGLVQNKTGATLNTESLAGGVTNFLRPEDGAWDPSNPKDFYFNTTHQLDQVSDGVGTQVGNSRVWRLRFDDPTNPELGGTIEAVIDGVTDKDTNGNTVKVNMLDNMGIDRYGHIILQEDVGNAAHNGKVWQYDIATDRLSQIAKFDPARFGDVVNGVTTPATTPFTIDEESSGVIDAQDILGPGWFLLDAQAHYGITSDTSLVEGGQLLAVYNPTTANSAATAKNKVAFSAVAAGDATTSSEILWTRTVDANTKQGIRTDLTAQVSTDANFTTIAKTYTVTSDPNRDYTAKLDATGLNSNTKYYYRFQTGGGDTSAVGTFKTAADVTAKVGVKFAFSGDADGLMRPYASTQNFNSLNLDYFLFEGDTIYETTSGLGTQTAPGNNFSATAVPSTINTVIPITDANASQALIDYQRKYLENLQPTTPGGFAGLTTLYASQGNYTLLDNHELGNRQLINGGAPSALATDTTVNNQNGSNNTAYDANKTGTFINDSTGFKTLVQAYSNYQPIREKTVSAPNDARTDGTQQLYLAQQWGRNSVFLNLDTRSYRDVRLKQANGSTDDTGSRADNPDRTMLGKTQLAWLKQTLLDAQKNGTIWKFVATSDPIDQIGAIGSGEDGGKSWIGGYRAERNDLLKFIADNQIKNVVFMATDDHQTRINELTYTDNGVVKVLPNAISVVDGPIGATGPDLVTNHAFSNLQTLASTQAKNQIAANVNPVGLDSKTTSFKNLKRDKDGILTPVTLTGDATVDAVNFYSPDTFNYTIFDISPDGKTLNVNVQGINSYAKNTFPEPSTTGPVRDILSFSLDANLDNKLFKVSDDVFDISANNTGESKLKVSITKPSSNQVYQLGVFVVDNASGAIGGVLPTSADYAKAALAKAQVILSGIANLPKGYSPSASDLTRLLQLSPDQSLRFYLSSDSNPNASGSNLQFSTVQKVTDLGADGFALDFKDLSVNIKTTTETASLGTALQGSTEGEVLDLRGVTGTVTVDFTVNREAAYNNYVGFYKVDDALTGSIGGLKPGDAGYAQAAVKARVGGIDLQVGNQGTGTFTGKQLTGGEVFAPFLIVNATADQFLNGQADQVYFNYLGANPDKVDHVRLLGNNTFGFEDILGGGDRDFNDVIVRANVKV
jgi:phosphodiesterase/alkaline phosphatase D-like protein